MICIITGVETQNKYQNIPISTDAIKAAKKFQALEPGMTLRQALRKLNKDYFEMMKNKVNDADASRSDQVRSCE